jgi:toxin ParE1/3/4
MKVVFTDQSIESLEEALNFSIFVLGLPQEKAIIIRNRLFQRADGLAINFKKGQREELLQHLNEDHRRIVEGHFKIIYKAEGDIIYITDFFDSRQNPNKMKS